MCFAVCPTLPKNHDEPTDVETSQHTICIEKFYKKFRAAVLQTGALKQALPITRQVWSFVPWSDPASQATPYHLLQMPSVL